MTDFSFNKGEKFDISKFDGIKQSELRLKVQGNKDQANLVDSIFNRYDKNHDGYLVEDEYKELERDLSQLSRGDNNLGKVELHKFNREYLDVKKNYYSMSDLENVIKAMTDSNDGIKVSRNGEFLKVEDSNPTATYKSKVEYFKLIPRKSASENKGNSAQVYRYSDKPQVKRTQSTITTDDGTEITTKFDDDEIMSEVIKKTTS